MLTSEMCASIEPNHLGDVHCVCACGQKRQVMPQPSLSHPMGLQPPCASSWSLMWPEIVSRDRKLRSVRVLRFWLASMTPLVGSVAEKLKYSKLITVVYAPLRASRRLSAACTDRAQRVVQRRDMALHGLWEPYLYAQCTI